MFLLFKKMKDVVRTTNETTKQKFTRRRKEKLREGEK